MDYQTHNTRSNGLTIASLTMGILSLATSCFIYTAVPFGALAIIFALLSRGIEHDLDPKALAGLLLGIIGLIVAVVVFIAMFIYAINYYGGLDNLLQYSTDLSNQYLQMYE